MEDIKLAMEELRDKYKEWIDRLENEKKENQCEAPFMEDFYKLVVLLKDECVNNNIDIETFMQQLQGVNEKEL